MPFTPKFVDLVRNFTTVQGTGPAALGSAVNGYTSIASALSTGDQFYYCIQGIDKPQEREVGRGTLQADGKVGREAIAGSLTNFSSGTKTIALVAAAEWFAKLEAGGGGGGGAAIDVESRAALAAITGQTARSTRYLTEPGREGLFVWNGSNLAAEVALDPRQGVYVAPASAPTGASGAWVRKFAGPVHVDWFGAKGDDLTDDGPAFAAALDFLDRNRVDYQGAQTLRCGAKDYFLGTTQLNIRTTLVFEGVSCLGTKLRWAAGTKGIVVQRLNTADGTTVGGEYLGAGDRAIIRQMMLKGAARDDGAVPEGEFHGIELRARATLTDLEICYFQGDGIYSMAIAGSGGANEGNSNCAQISRVVAHHNRNGLKIDGTDSNAWFVSGCDFRENRRWGVWDSSFLGNTYVGCHFAANGADGVWGVAGVPRTNCTFGGHTYMVAPNQGAGAAANPPTGTPTSNTWWLYRPQGGYAEPHSGSLTYRDGGALRTDEPAGTNALFGCYAEGGQNSLMLNGKDLVSGGLLEECGVIDWQGRVWGGWINGSSNRVRLAGRLEVANAAELNGGDNFIGPAGGTPYNAVTTFRTTGSYLSVVFQHVGAGNAAYMFSMSGAGLYINSFGKTFMWVNEAAVAEFESAGLNLVAGKVLKVGGNQVVGARQAAVADATGGSTVDAEARAAINALLARLRTHGLIAT